MDAQLELRFSPEGQLEELHLRFRPRKTQPPEPQTVVVDGRTLSDKVIPLRRAS